MLILGHGLKMRKIIHDLTEQEVEVICRPCDNSHLEIQPARDAEKTP